MHVILSHLSIRYIFFNIITSQILDEAKPFGRGRQDVVHLEEITTATLAELDDATMAVLDQVLVALGMPMSRHAVSKGEVARQLRFATLVRQSDRDTIAGSMRICFEQLCCLAKRLKGSDYEYDSNRFA